MKPDKDGIYEMTDTRPAHPGGQEALENYVNNNIEYQQPAIDDNTEGTVNVQFVVDENGNVTNAKEIGKELGNRLDQEAVRVISNMPKWTPGKVKGKNVKTRVVLPVTYKIEE
jgi:protein TonB